MQSTQSTLTYGGALAPRSANVPPAPQQNAGQKRKADAPAATTNLDHIDVDGMYIDQSCQQIRAKIRKFIDSGEMNITTFNKTIGVTDHSMRTFLGQNGMMKGSGSNSYLFAWEFFKKREMMGIKMPSKKQKVDGADAEKTKKAKENVKLAGNTAGVDISDIHLPGEEDDSVPVYEACDEVRKKINAHLRKPGVTQADFCRDCQAQLHSPGAAKIQSVMLTRFRSMVGARKGAANSIYYGAYVFFEKVRVKEGKQKSQHRLKMEKIWPRGMERRNDHGWITLGPGEYPHEDEFGQISITR